MVLRDSVQSLSRVQLFVTPRTATSQSSLSINSQSLLKVMSIESVMPSHHLILCHPHLLLPSIFPSIRVFSALCIRWLKYWSFSFSISPSDEYSGLISFRIYWFELLAVQGTLHIGWDLIPPNRLSHLRISHMLTLRSTYQDSFFTWCFLGLSFWHSATWSLLREKWSPLSQVVLFSLLELAFRILTKQLQTEGSVCFNFVWKPILFIKSCGIAKVRS